MRFLKAAVTAAALFLLVQSAWAKTDTVRAVDFSFVPASLTINRGDTVVFRSTQQCCDAHTSTRTGLYSWDSGPIPMNGNFKVAFRDAGHFDYFCVPHEGVGMVGTINVADRVPSTGWMGLVLLLASLTAAAIYLLEKERRGGFWPANSER